jgi:hypothetical protein
VIALLASLSFTAGLALQVQAAVPTVGDTVWVSRTVTVRAGAVVRPAPWPDEAGGVVQPLGPPMTIRHGGAVEIRYPLVVWSSGEHRIDIPGPAILGPGAATDSLDSEPATLFVRSVLPDSLDPDSAAPQPLAETLGGTEISWRPLIQFALLGAALAAGALWLGRRRRPRDESVTVATPPAPDAIGWAKAGELRAAQAAALARLRAIVARAVPAASAGLDTESCLRMLRPVRPDWPLLELEGLLLGLEAERFAPGEGDPDLVDRADALRSELERQG